MKKIYLLALLLATVVGNAQFEQVTYRGAFAPAPAAQWTDTWTNWDPNNADYPGDTDYSGTPKTLVTVSGEINTDTSWTADKYYVLSGQTYVTNGATLTIAAGTIIRSSAAGAGLFVTRGCKINATGTAAAPIVFTSLNQKGSRSKGDWGGVILLGKASYNINNGIGFIEGIAPSVNTCFGKDIDAASITTTFSALNGSVNQLLVASGGNAPYASERSGSVTISGLDYVQSSTIVKIYKKDTDGKYYQINTSGAFVLVSGNKVEGIKGADASICSTTVVSPATVLTTSTPGIATYIVTPVFQGTPTASAGSTFNDADNSGTLKFVRIEFGGYIYVQDKEINGLTFGAVGSGTTVDYVQVSDANDDSFEWFGGTVNCKHLVAFRGLDDDFDTDNGFSGNVQFILGVRDPNVSDQSTTSTSEAFECDNQGTAGTLTSGQYFYGTPFTSAIFSNCTLIGNLYRNTNATTTGAYKQYKRGARLRRNDKQKIFNSLFMDWPEGLNVDGYDSETNAIGTNADNVDGLKFKKNLIAGLLPANTVKVAFVNATSGGTGATAPNGTFNIATWFTASGNDVASFVSNTDAAGNQILAKPYNTSKTDYVAGTGTTFSTGIDYRPFTAGTQSLLLTNAASFTDSVFTGKILGTNDYKLNATALLAAYPNPFTTGFKLEYTSMNTEKVNVSVYNASGSIVETKSLDYDAVKSFEFGSNYTTGLYIVVVKQANITKTFKVIKE